MRNPARFVVAVMILAIFAKLAWSVLQPNEPTYNGKRLTDWMEQYEKHLVAGPWTKRDEAEQSIRQIGTNAIPTLLNLIRARDSSLKKTLLAVVRKQSLVKLQLHPADYYHAKASYGYWSPGSNSKTRRSSLN